MIAACRFSWLSSRPASCRSRGYYRKTSARPPWPSEKLIELSKDRRIGELTTLPVENAEPIQVLRFLPRTEYRPTDDFFDPGSAGRIDAEVGGHRLVPRTRPYGCVNRRPRRKGAPRSHARPCPVRLDGAAAGVLDSCARP
jgi:hypothetical protein